MAQPTTHVMIVKADVDGDMRRMSLELQEDSPAAQTLQAIRAAVAQGFDTQDTLLSTFNYRDEDGSLCMLLERSVYDMLRVNNSGVLRVFASRIVEAPMEEETQDHTTSAPSASVQAPSDLCTVGSTQRLPEDPEQSAPLNLIKEEEEEKEEEPQVQCVDDMDGVKTLVSMGFSHEQAHRALKDARGNVELAVEYLIIGPRRTSLKKIEHTLRAFPMSVGDKLRKLQGQLREVVINARRQQERAQERFHSCEIEHIQSLQASLEELKARLGEFRVLAQAALKKARGNQPDAQEEQQLQKVEARVADAHQFVVETLTMLHTRASEVRRRAATAFSECSSHAAPAEGSDSVAIATAAMDTAEAVMATVDEFFLHETNTTSAISAAIASDGTTLEQCRQQINEGDAASVDGFLLVSDALQKSNDEEDA